MRHIFILITLASFVMLACNQSNKSADKQTDTTMKKTELLKKEDQLIKNDKSSTEPGGDTTVNGRNDLDFLREMDGKYPADVKLLENPVLVARLNKLLGSRFAFMKKTWGVETPIEVRNNIFIASGCEQHNCGSTNFMIVVDLEKNKIWAGIREEENATTFSEDGSASADLQKWANQI